MTAEQQHAEDTERQEAALTITVEDFAAVELEAPIRESRNLDCWSLGSLYQSAASEAKANGNEAEARVFALLVGITNIHFKPEDRAEPYGPLSVFDRKRTLIPSDLRGEPSAAIAEAVPAIQNPGLRARLADIAWQNDRRLAAMAQQAIDAYCESVELVLGGKGEFFNDDRTASGHDGCAMLRRACQIAQVTGWKDPGAARLGSLVTAVVRDAIDRRDHRGFSNASEVALECGFGDPAAIAVNAETFAESEAVDPHWSRDLWELAARAHSRLKNEQERDRCLVGAAESHVTIADAGGGKGTVAAGALMDAIQALRQLSNTKVRRQEIEERLRHAQASVRDEMGVISTTFDLTEYIEHARRCGALARTATGALTGNVSVDEEGLKRRPRRPEHPDSDYSPVSATIQIRFRGSSARMSSSSLS